MREILFRGKRLDNGEWIASGNIIHFNPEHGEDPVFIPGFNEKCTSTHDEFDNIIAFIEVAFYKVDPKTVGQFTGLTDKNGVKIFEGDVFEFPDEIFESFDTSCGTEYNSWETENRGVVGYNEDYGRYDFVQYKYGNNTVEADMHENKYIEFADFVSQLEVIGNIHDNPELLDDYCSYGERKDNGL